MTDKGGYLPVLAPGQPGLEITPEIAGKNTSISAMIVYLPENLAGRNYTYLLV